jgi:hypothetical protein
LSFLHYYAVAIEGVLLAICLIPLLYILDKKTAETSFIGVILGSLLGFIAMIVVFGWSEITAMFGDVLALVDHSVFWNNWPMFIQMPDSGGDVADGTIMLSKAIFIHVFSFFFLLSQISRHGIKNTVEVFYPIIILQIVAFIHLRGGLDLSDVGHIYASVSFSSLLIIAYGSIFVYSRGYGFIRYIKKNFIEELALLTVFVSIILIISIFLTTRFNGTNLKSHFDFINTPDSRYLENRHKDIIRIMKPEIQQSECFYLLTSGGLWYHLFDTPSCSRFHGPFWARTVAEQELVRRDLKKHKPDIILFESKAYEHTFNGISIFNRNKIIVRYVMQNYRPYYYDHGYWFWKRTNEGYQFDSESIGYLDDNIIGDKILDLNVLGTLGRTLSDNENSALFILKNMDKVPIWSGRLQEARTKYANSSTETYDQANRFLIDIPYASLEKGEHALSLWLLITPNAPLKQIGADFKIIVE